MLTFDIHRYLKCWIFSCWLGCCGTTCKHWHSITVWKWLLCLWPHAKLVNIIIGRACFSDCSMKTMVTPEEVIIDAALTSSIAELKSISSLTQEQRTALKAFLCVKDVLLLTFCKSWIHQLTSSLARWSDWMKLACDGTTFSLTRTTF